MKLLHWLTAFAVAVASAAVLAASTIVGSVQLPPGSYADTDADPVLHRYYGLNSAANTLVAIDVDTMQIVAAVSVDATSTRMRVDAAHHRVYVLHKTSPGQITTYDGKSLAVIARTTIADKPSDLAVDFRRGEIYLFHDEPGHHFTIFDTKTSTVAATLQLCCYMYGITVDRNAGKIYVPQYGGRQVTVISQASRSVVKNIPVNMYPVGAAVEEKSGSVFISGFADLTATQVDQVAVIDSATDTVRWTSSDMVLSLANVGRFDPLSSPVYGRAYFSNPAQGQVTIADAATASSKTVAVAGNPSVEAVNPENGEIYVTDRGGSSVVTVLDARLERVAGTLDVGMRTGSIHLVAHKLLIFGRDPANNPKVVAATPYGIQKPTSVIVSDFYHAGFDHYFHSASSEETRALQDGVFGTDWKQTQQYWRVFDKPLAGFAVPVCRFFSSGFGSKSSHFYTPYASECEELKKGTTWTYEETSYYVALPDAAGACTPGFEELYRLYNNGMGGAPNHAYTSSRAKRDALQAAGWTPEGSGPQSVFACTPPLKGFVTSPP